MYLFVNNLDQNKVTIAIVGSKGVYEQSCSFRLGQHVNLLVLLDKLLKKNKINLKKITGIGVVNGPGGFSAIRTALALVNALAYAFKIPVVDLTWRENFSLESYLKLMKKKLSKIRTKKMILATPFYGREPNITRSKKKSLI